MPRCRRWSDIPCALAAGTSLSYCDAVYLRDACERQSYPCAPTVYGACRDPYGEYAAWYRAHHLAPIACPALPQYPAPYQCPPPGWPCAVRGPAYPYDWM